MHNVAKKLHIQEINQEKSFVILRVFILLENRFSQHAIFNLPTTDVKKVKVMKIL